MLLTAREGHRCRNNGERFTFPASKRTRRMKKEAVVFAFIFVGMSWVIDALHLPYGDEIWLISGIVAAFVLCLVRPNSKEAYLRCIGPIILVVFAAYIIVIK